MGVSSPYCIATAVLFCGRIFSERSDLERSDLERSDLERSSYGRILSLSDAGLSRHREKSRKKVNGPKKELANAL